MANQYLSSITLANGTVVGGVFSAIAAADLPNTFPYHVAFGPDAVVDDITLFYPAQTQSSVVNVAQVYTSVGPNALQGVTSYVYYNPTADNFNTVTGLDGQAFVFTTNTHGQGFLYGVRGAAKHRGTGLVSALYGCAGIVFNSSTGTVSEAHALYASVNNVTTGAVTSAYGCRIDTPTGIDYTNLYGVYIADQTAATATNNFNLYSAGTSSLNYFGGQVVVGTTTPGGTGTRLTVKSDANTHVPVIIKGASGQANNASYFQVQRDDGIVLLSMEEDTLTSAGGALSIHSDVGGVTGQFRTNVGGGTSGMDITAFNSLHLINLNAGTMAIIPAQPTDWLVYGGNLLKFAGYTGFGGTVACYDRNTGNTIVTALLTNDDPTGPSLGVTQWNAGVTPFFVRGAASQTAVLCQLRGISSTSTDREQADIDTSWADSTDATRKARVSLRVWDTAAREAIRLDTDGANPAIGLFGTETFYTHSSTNAVREQVDFQPSAIDNTDATRKYQMFCHVWDTAQRNAWRIQTNQSRGEFSVPRGGTTSAWAKAGGVIFDDFADVNNGGTAETDLYSHSVNASTLSVDGDKLSWRVGGVVTGSGTSTQQIRAYFGGTLVYDSGAMAVNATVGFDFTLLVVRESSSVVRCIGTLRGFTSTLLAADSQYTRVTGLTLSNANTLKITGTAGGGGGGSNQITASLSSLWFYPAA